MDGYEVFVAVIESGNFSSAAKKLGVTSSAVSKQISRLEKQLGVQLLTRSTRALALTEPGTLCYTKYQEILKQRREMELEISNLQSNPEGILKLTASRTFGQQYLLPHLARFQKAYPEIKIEMNLSGEKIDIIQGGFDLAIREGQLDDSNLNARKLSSFGVVACATPAFLDANPMACLDEILNAKMIQFNNEHAEAKCGQMFNDNNGFQIAAFKNVVLSLNELSAIRSSVLAGIGFAFLPDYLVEQDLADGRLLSISTPFEFPATEVHALYSSNRGASGKVRAFIDFMVEQLASQNLKTNKAEKLPQAFAARAKTLSDSKPNLDSTSQSLSQWDSGEVLARQQVA